MSIEITEFDTADRDEWNELVSRSAAGTFFHHYDVLEVIEKHASARLYPLVGHKGQEPVGLFPVFELRNKGITMAFSPPPELGLLFMGPVTLMHDGLKRRKRERRRRRFVEGCLDVIEERVNPRYYRFCTPVGYKDPRPFTWNEYEMSPLHTYRLDLERDTDEIKRSFSKSLRRYLDTDEDNRFVVEEGDQDAIQFIHEQVTARYEAQDKTYSVPLKFLTDLYEHSADGRVRPYIAHVDGERVSGIIVLEDESTIYFSEGGGKPDVDFPINDVLHWRIIRDAREREIETYDLYGANTPRICEYKSKFNSDLATYYEAEKGSLVMSTAVKLYKKYG